MQETEVIATRTDGPTNASGILNLFTSAAQTAGQVYGAISTANAQSKLASAQADATRATAQPVISPAPVASSAATKTATSDSWIKGVSNKVVIIGGLVILVLFGSVFLFRRRK